MDRAHLLAEIAAAQVGPGDVVYLERRGEVYSWAKLAAGAVAVHAAGRSGQQEGSSPKRPSVAAGSGTARPGSAPDTWLYYCGPWPSASSQLPEFLDDLLAEMESMSGGADRCRWPLDQPYPHRH
jgi:hypothetical protein